MGRIPRGVADQLPAGPESNEDISRLLDGQRQVIPLSAIRYVETLKDAYWVRVTWQAGQEERTDSVYLNTTGESRNLFNCLAGHLGSGWKQEQLRDWQAVRQEVGLGIFLIAFVLLVTALAFGFSMRKMEDPWDSPEPMSIKKLVFASILWFFGKLLGPVGTISLGVLVVGLLFYFVIIKSWRDSLKIVRLSAK